MLLHVIVKPVIWDFVVQRKLVEDSFIESGTWDLTRECKAISRRPSWMFSRNFLMLFKMFLKQGIQLLNNNLRNNKCTPDSEISNELNNLYIYIMFVFFMLYFFCILNYYINFDIYFFKYCIFKLYIFLFQSSFPFFKS